MATVTSNLRAFSRERAPSGTEVRSPGPLRLRRLPLRPPARRALPRTRAHGAGQLGSKFLSALRPAARDPGATLRRKRRAREGRVGARRRRGEREAAQARTALV